MSTHKSLASDESLADRLPDGKPPRNNSGRDCPEPHVNVDRGLPRHIRPCRCPHHDGVCQECHYHITIGASGLEYGHARATNKGPDCNGPREDCPHRASETLNPRPDLEHDD